MSLYKKASIGPTQIDDGNHVHRQRKRLKIGPDFNFTGLQVTTAYSLSLVRALFRRKRKCVEMAQIHFDYDTDVLPKRFAEEAVEEDVPRTKTRKGAAGKAKPAEAAQKRRRGEEESTQEAPLSPTQQVNKGLSEERLAKLQALKQRMVRSLLCIPNVYAMLMYVV